MRRGRGAQGFEKWRGRFGYELAGNAGIEGNSDGALELSLRGLVAAGRRVEARLVEHLREVEARRLHLTSGYESMFRYCQERLGFSEYEAFSRISAARLAKQFPVVVELLERQELNLTTLYLVRDYVSVENHAEIFSAVARKTKREVLLLMARRSPRPDVPARLRKLPSSGGRTLLEPLSGESFCLTMTVSAELKNKLDHARDLMSHVHGGRELEVVIERAVDLLIAKLEKRTGKLAATSQAGASGAAKPASRAPRGETNASGETKAKRVSAETRGMALTRPHLPNALRRQIFERDGGRCTFVAADGRRCGCRAFVQVHHELPWARGGADAIDNLRLLCAAHNQLHAEQDYGSAHVTRALAQKRGRRRAA